MHHPKKLIGLLFVASTLLTLLGCGSDDTTETQPPPPPPQEQESVTISGAHSVEVGAKLTLVAATVNGTDSGYAWQSEDETIATVDSAGLVTAVLPGETAIFATGLDTGAEGGHPLVVLEVAPPAEPTVTITGDVFVPVGGTGQLTAATTNGTDSAYEWSSSDEEVASIDAAGMVTGLRQGEVTITAVGVDTQASGTRDMVVALGLPNYDDWAKSGHADYSAEAFNHWNDDGEVSASCARCHSTPGYRDYLGDDGTAAFSVESAAPTGTVIECAACHNNTATYLTTVIFPGDSTNPGVQLDNLDTASARCMTCHQGRKSTAAVDEKIADAAVTSDDEVSADLSFQNVHYFPAGATVNAGRVAVGYQYAGKTYDWRFRHVPGKNTCTGCHNPHSLEIDVSDCATCHLGVTTLDDLKDIRMMSSRAHDYDGDGDKAEGLAREIEGLQAKLLAAIQAYPSSQSIDAICYYSGAHPYWFIDTNGDGACDSNEADSSNRYASWTARLLRATYNYQLSQKDPGAFAHNGKYLIQLLYDAIEDLDTVTGAPQLGTAVRNDPGHFDGAAEPARHWDGDDGVSGSCAKCHGGSEGFLFYLDEGFSITTSEEGNGHECAVCHVNAATERPGQNAIAVDDVTFPSDVTLDLGGTANLCGTCHSGRESGADIDEAIAASNFRFLNVHYLPAAAVKFGGAAEVGYQYPAKQYSLVDASPHNGTNDCTFCHNPGVTLHTFDVQDTFASGGCSCHSGSATAHDIRFDTTDYDNDGSSSEPLGGEVGTIAAGLLLEMKAYGIAIGHPICYEGHSYPYFFIDTHNSPTGECDPADAMFSNRYASWDGALMKAAHNYQISQKDPGAWAHNLDYMLQLLIDSMDDLNPGSSVAAGFIRPSP